MTTSPTPDTPDQVREIARNLTKAQREALLTATCAVPPQKDERSLDCICASDQCEALQQLGLAEPRTRWPNGVVRSPLGLAVRDLLLSQPHPEQKP